MIFTLDQNMGIRFQESWLVQVCVLSAVLNFLTTFHDIPYLGPASEVYRTVPALWSKIVFEQVQLSTP